MIPPSGHAQSKKVVSNETVKKGACPDNQDEICRSLRKCDTKGCPTCDSQRIHRSRRRGLVERTILSLVFVRPFRCEVCSTRFFRLSLAAQLSALRSLAVTRRFGRERWLC